MGSLIKLSNERVWRTYIGGSLIEVQEPTDYTIFQATAAKKQYLSENASAAAFAAAVFCINWFNLQE